MPKGPPDRPVTGEAAKALIGMVSSEIAKHVNKITRRNSHVSDPIVVFALVSLARNAVDSWPAGHPAKQPMLDTLRSFFEQDPNDLPWSEKPKTEWVDLPPEPRGV